MSVDMIAVSGASFNVTNVGWRFIWEFARRGGWQPTGTAPPSGHAGAWDGSYDPAIGQSVRQIDAASLGEAVDGALAHPDLDGVLSQVTAALTAHANALGYPGPAAVVTQKTLRMLKEFAGFARASGGFRIE